MSAAGTPHFGGGPPREGRVKLPTNNAQEIEQTASLTVRSVAVIRHGGSRPMSIARTETPATGLNGRSIAFQDAQPRDLPPPAARCARRPMRWRGHRPCRSCGRCRSRAPAPVRRAWAARPPPTRLPPPASLPGAYPEAAGVLHRLGRRSGNRFAQRSSDLKPVRSYLPLFTEVPRETV